MGLGAFDRRQLGAMIQGGWEMGNGRKRESKAEVLFHPVRMRIVRVLSGGEHYTAQEIGRMLSDVPPATLYRHINKLADEGFLKVVEQRPVGGATERVFALRDQAGFLSAADLASATPEDHMRYFTTFCAMLMSEFETYLKRDVIDLEADGVGYRMQSLYLNDDEFKEMIKRLREVIDAYRHNSPDPGRRRRLLSTIIMPADD